MPGPPVLGAGLGATAALPTVDRPGTGRPGPPVIPGSGLPAYTLPPLVGGPLPPHPASPQVAGLPLPPPHAAGPQVAGPPRPPHPVSPPVAGLRGEPSSQVGGLPTQAPGHGTGGVPAQRRQGTVYGGHAAADLTVPVSAGAIDMTMPVQMNPLENSGSLTGHILAQGWPEAPGAPERSNAKVVLWMLLVLLALGAISMLFLFTVGSEVSNLLHGVFHK
jgi:hypothetical protein